MANTTYLRQVVEGYVREQLTEEFGQPFSPRFLTLLPGGRHEFDAVSADGRVIASIKSASGLTAGGRVPSGKIKDCVAELYYLSLVEAPVRRLVLATPDFFQLFVKVTAGAVAVGIEVASLPLPAAIQAEVDKVVEEASREVSPDRAKRAIAADVEGSLDQE